MFSVLYLLEIFRLIRWVNCLLASVGVAIGAYLAWLTPAYYGPAVAAVAAFFVCAAGNILNDIVDIEIDRVNRPHRVLVRQAISVRAALRLAIAFNVLALALAAMVNWQVVAVASATIGLLVAYNLYLKKIPLVGNVAVALLAGMTFITGGLAYDPVHDLPPSPGPLIPAAFAFFFHLVREIVKDVQDIEGDSRSGVTSLPQVVGVSRSLLLALILFLMLTILTYIPILARWFDQPYETITVYIVDLPLLVLLILVWGNPSPRMLAIGSSALKVGNGARVGCPGAGLNGPSFDETIETVAEYNRSYAAGVRPRRVSCKTANSYRQQGERSVTTEE